MKKRPLILFIALLGAGALNWAVNRDPRGSSAPMDDFSARKSTESHERRKVAVTPEASSSAGEDEYADAPVDLNDKDARPGEAVLSFKDAAAYARFLNRAAAAGVALLDRSAALNSVRVRVENRAALARDWAAHAQDYADASANYLIRVPSTPLKEERAAIRQIPFENGTLEFLGATGDRATWGRGVTIAILDTGVAADLTFGTGRLRKLDIGYGLSPGEDATAGHGTAVASLAAGQAADAPGVAPAANVLSIRVTDPSGVSDIFTVSRAIVAAVDAGATIVNVSLGGYGSNAALNAALAYATDRGVVIVAAAGNDQATQLAWPAADRRVISVGAVDSAENQVIFSNSGPQLSLTAPGFGVQSAWSGGARVLMDGTSASSPLVAGAIAAVLSQNPALDAPAAAKLVLQTASDAGPPGADADYGRGILNVGWAMNANNPNYVDTAVASHFYDPVRGQVGFVVQNRSGRAVTGATLEVLVGDARAAHTIAPLPPGGAHTVYTPAPAGASAFNTTLLNPPGVFDQRPGNNRKSSVLAPAPAPRAAR